MRLEQHDQIFVGPARTRGFNRGVHFRWVVTIIIDQHRGPGFTVHWFKREFAEEVETTSGTLEALQRTQNSVVFNTFFRRNRHRSRGVQRIVAARRV